jgi:exodeoxyribonuclease VII large subunit
MNDLLDDGPPQGGNAREFTVSEISGAVKRMIEGEFGHVRVRGEVGRTMLARSGHLYFDLKDDRSVIASVSWKGQVARLAVMPEEGMEVIATGRLTTFPGQSKYQLIVESVEPAGAGALMAMLEKRRKALQAEGLFDPARKQTLPYLPGVIGVVTSPTGAVIRDILHRLRDRFPRHVLIWPVAVQGKDCAPQVANAINGFNAIQPGGPIPRPDLIIVARGGGSVEDLWGFNEEIVVRAAANSGIPLISAVGHETDTTLIDYASDMRAPTPTAAAEMAVPVRAELLAALSEYRARLTRAQTRLLQHSRQRLSDVSRALPRPDRLTETARQGLDRAAERLPRALLHNTQIKRNGFAQISALVRAETLETRLKTLKTRLGDRADRLDPTRLERLGANGRQQIDRLNPALNLGFSRRLADARKELAGQARTLHSLSYRATLERGFAVVRDADHVISTQEQAQKATALELEFKDGRIKISGASRARKPDTQDKDEQGSLF